MESSTNLEPPSTSLTHISLSSFCGTSPNSAKSEQMPQNTSSDQVLNCLQTDVSFKT